jgi:Ni,Fe-hydrogenase III small subunit
MLDLIRARLGQRTQTSPFPRGDTEFPVRFRGLPVLNDAGCGSGLKEPLAGKCPTDFVRPRDPSGMALDLGACLFSPEEAVGLPDCGVRFSQDVRLAAGTREGLVSADGSWEGVRALDAQMQSLFGRSLRLRSVVAGSCGGCEAELAAMGNVVFDMARFGIQFVASPRHADGIVITGAVSHNMREALLRTYDAVPDPRIVIAVGACACSGGPFRGSPEVAEAIPEQIPVDLWVPGCPPHPLTVLDGLLRLLGRIDGGNRGAAPVREHA